MLELHSPFIVTFAGIALFMFGMSLASENLEKLSANRMRDILNQVSKKPYLGVVIGALLTVMIQSSGAVTTMLVGLGSAGVITLPQVMSLIIGTAIGTTFTVQIISFNVTQYGLALFAFSFMVYFLTNKRALKNFMAVLMGFGLIFWGMEIIAEGTSELRHVEVFNTLLTNLKEHPFYAVLATAFFTAIVHSSAVTIGFAMSLTAGGLLNLTDAVYWIFGANIGTTATALIASAGGNYVGRQVAWAHCFYKIATILLFYPFAEPMAKFLATSSVERDIANIHTFYNILAAIIFFPGIKYGAQLIEKFFPPSAADRAFSVKFLNKTDWESPSIACAHAEREAMRMGDIVLTMLQDSLSLFKKEDPDLIQSIRRRDDRVDLLNREINLYLARQLNGVSGTPDYLQMMKVMSFCTDLESSADVIDNQLLDLSNKKHGLKLEFSEEGWKDLEEIHRAVVQVASLSLGCFQRPSTEVASKVIFHKRNIRKLEKRMREAHMARLVSGRQDSINTSSIHMDVLGEYRRVAGLMSNHVYSLLKDTDPYNLLPRRES